MHVTYKVLQDPARNATLPCEISACQRDRQAMVAILLNQRLAAEVEATQIFFTFSPALGWWSQYRDKNSFRLHEFLLYSLPALTGRPPNWVERDSHCVTGPWPLKSYKYINKSSFQNLQLNSQNLVTCFLDFKLQKHNFSCK